MACARRMISVGARFTHLPDWRIAESISESAARGGKKLKEVRPRADWGGTQQVYTGFGGFGSRGCPCTRGAGVRFSLLFKSANIRSKSKSNLAA